MILVSGVNHLAAAAFDRIASSYDELFTDTAVGRAQRRQVWTRLLEAFPPGSRILELNCGTGGDARFLASRGRSVLACDASRAMIQVAQQRHRGNNTRNAEYRVVANEDLGFLLGEKCFDGAFSNFSGFNCVADLATVAASLAKLVKPGGRVLVCVWSRTCVTEMLWYLLRGEFKKAARRLSTSSEVTLGGLAISVYYPGVPEIRASFAPWFQLLSRRAIGLFVPPSYVEQWVNTRPHLLARLERFDEWSAAWPILRDLGDHVLLEFERCSP